MREKFTREQTKHIFKWRDTLWKLRPEYTNVAAFNIWQKELGVIAKWISVIYGLPAPTFEQWVYALGEDEQGEYEENEGLKAGKG